MNAFIMVVASSWLAFGASEGMGTNGGGETRTWTIITGDTPRSVKAAFARVSDGVVTLHSTQPYSVTTRSPNLRRTENIDMPIASRVRLADLCLSDRKWIEERNPKATCLTAKSKKGDAGTLVPKFGSYTVVDILDPENAIISEKEVDKVVWTFWLHSHLVSGLKPSETYNKIDWEELNSDKEADANKDAAAKKTVEKKRGQKDKDAQAAKSGDFQKSGRKKYKNKLVDCVEDSF